MRPYLGESKDRVLVAVLPRANSVGLQLGHIQRIKDNKIR